MFFYCMRKISFILLLCVVFVTSNATELLTDTLRYSDFSLANSGWTTTTVGTPVTATRTLQSPSLTYINSSLQYIYSGCGLTLNNYYKGASGASFTSYKPINGGSSVSAPVYLSFLYKVQAQGGSNAQIIGMTNSGTSTGGIHIWNKGVSATTFQLGITRYSTTSTAIQWNSTILDATQTYLVVVKWDGTKASLFVNPILDSSTEPSASTFDDGSVNNVTTTITTLSHLIMRGNASNHVYFYMGGIRVSTTWAEAVTSKSYVPPVSTNLPAPTVGSATNISSTSFTANWTPVSNAVGYTVKVYWGSTFVDSTNVNGQSSASIAVSKLVPNLTYTFKVIAKGDGSNYTDSNLSSASTAFTLLRANIPTKNKLKIILKLDDFSVNTSTGFAASAVYDYLKANNVKANMGAIANRFDNTAGAVMAPYLNSTNQAGDTLFEVWNHGYDHVNPEFSGTAYDYQKTHFENATNLIKSYLGIQMHSFGTPYNASDAVTNTVIGENPNYKVMMFSNVISATNGVFYMNNRVNMESATANPVYNYFVANYNTYKNTYKDYMVLQGHPNTYSQNPATIDQLKLIVQFLISEGVEFVRCFDYYRSLSLNAPTNLSANEVFSNQVKLTWTDNSTTENGFRIERSTDGINYTQIGTTPSNTSSFTDINTSASSTYYYRVYATCGMNSDYSNVIQVLTLNTGNNIMNDNSTFSVFLGQNKILNISCSNSKSGFCDFELVDISGQLIKNIYSGNLASGSFTFNNDLSNLGSGVFFCRFKTPVTIITQKVILK